MKKKKQQKNYLDLIPERAPELTWNSDDEGIITLEVENTGAFNRIAQKLFKSRNIRRCIWRNTEVSCGRSLMASGR